MIKIEDYRGFEIIYKKGNSLNVEPTSYEISPAPEKDMRYVAFVRNKTFGKDFDELGKILSKM